MKVSARTIRKASVFVPNLKLENSWFYFYNKILYGQILARKENTGFKVTETSGVHYELWSVKGQRTWPLVAENAAHSALNEKQIPKYFLHRFVRESIDAMDENTGECSRPFEEIGTQDLHIFCSFLHSCSEITPTVCQSVRVRTNTSHSHYYCK